MNLPLASAIIEFDDGIISQQEIIEKIKSLGFGAIPADETDRKKEKEFKAKEFKILKTKLIISIVFSLPLLYIAMAPMVWGAAPLPDFLKMGSNPINYALVQLFLTLPVIVAGYRFFTRGFSNLFKGHPNMDSLVAIGTSAAFLYSVFT